MFYTKTINIYNSQPLIDEYGIVRKGELELVDTLKVDVQPVNKLRNEKEEGIEIATVFRIFSPLNDHIINGAYIEYRDKMYKITSVIEWDDYIEFLVGNIND